MAATYTWSVTGLSVFTDEDYKDVVHSVDWEVLGSEGTNKKLVSGTTPLGRPELGFTAYDELTEEQVLAWVKASMGELRVAEVETAVKSQLEQDKYKSKELPWKLS